MPLHRASGGEGGKARLLVVPSNGVMSEMRLPKRGVAQRGDFVSD